MHCFVGVCVPPLSQGGTRERQSVGMVRSIWTEKLFIHWCFIIIMSYIISCLMSSYTFNHRRVIVMSVISQNHLWRGSRKDPGQDRVGVDQHFVDTLGNKHFSPSNIVLPHVCKPAEPLLFTSRVSALWMHWWKPRLSHREWIQWLVSLRVNKASVCFHHENTGVGTVHDTRVVAPQRDEIQDNLLLNTQQLQ